MASKSQNTSDSGSGASKTITVSEDGESANTIGTIETYTGSTKDQAFGMTMQLFGIPYQFLPSVDQRVPGISNTIGRKFIDNIMHDSAVVTIIPGEPRYLPGVSDKAAWTNALLEGANDNFSALRTLANQGNNPDKIRLYDFQSAYTKYYQYVNILCRSCAGYLELGGETGYLINGKQVNFLNYDWKNYRWNGKNYSSVTTKIVKEAGTKVLSWLKSIISAGSSALTKVGLLKKTIDFSDSATKNADNDQLDSSENVLRSTNYLQFYCEADGSRGRESVTNSSQQSTFKQMLDTGSSAMRDIAFMANSGGIDTSSLSQLGDAANSALSEAMGIDVSNVTTGSTNSTVGGIMSRILSAGKSVIKGENIMMPDIWSGSENSKSYELVFKFKAMYGNRLSLYTDVIVPVMHLIALAYPRETSANTFTSPPLVKVYQKGVWTCNLGLISDIEITKDEVPESWNMDGLTTEVTVTLSVKDLYSEVAIPPANNPILFANNSSLIEYLATTCGLDLVDPQLTTRVKNMWNNAKALVQDIPKTMMGTVTENFDRVIASFTGL